MNSAQASIVLKCQIPKTAKEIWKICQMSKPYSYNYIIQILSELELLGKINKSKNGQSMIYRASKETVEEAYATLRFVNKIVEAGQNSLSQWLQ